MFKMSWEKGYIKKRVEANSMNIIRKVQKYGGSLIIVIGHKECEIEKITEGDLVEIELKKVEDKKKK